MISAILSSIAFALLYKFGTWAWSKLTIVFKANSELNRRIGELELSLQQEREGFARVMETNVKLQTDFEKLRHQKISADVKLGAKAENLLPFLEDFAYKDAEIRGLFNPIDLLVFTEDEVVFVEVKSGVAQLSEKQRKIRDNIKAGRVRFEIHRLDEKGIKVK